MIGMVNGLMDDLMNGRLDCWVVEWMGNGMDVFGWIVVWMNGRMV